MGCVQADEWVSEWKMVLFSRKMVKRLCSFVLSYCPVFYSWYSIIFSFLIFFSSFQHFNTHRIGFVCVKSHLKQWKHFVTFSLKDTRKLPRNFSCRPYSLQRVRDAVKSCQVYVFVFSYVYTATDGFSELKTKDRRRESSLS